MNLVTLLAEQARVRPAAPALIEGQGRARRVTTFAELDRRSQSAAARLRAAGLAPGAPVLIFQPMSSELYVALVAVVRLGAVAMFLDPSAGRRHLDRCCALSPPAALLASPRALWLRLLSPALRRIPRHFRLSGWAPWAPPLDAGAAELAIESVEASAPALLTFTSGSTGEPKAAMRTHGILVAQHRALAESLALTPGEIDLATLPIFVLANLASGVTSVIPDADLRRPGAIDAEPVIAQLRAEDVTRSAASPAFYERLLDVVGDGRHALAPLSTIYTGGAPVFPRLLTRLADAVAASGRAVAVYGSTEAEPIAHIARNEISPDDLAAMRAGRGLLTGHPVPQIDLRILPDRWGHPLGPWTGAEFTRECLPADAVGEIVVSGEHVLPGYLGGRGDAETKFSVDGRRWHRTGDAGRLDAQGRLWLLGRCAARIEDARGMLYPFTVECAAQEVFGVRRAALLAMGQERWLAVEPVAGEWPDHDGLTAIARAAGIDRIEAVDTIPVDVRHNAKIDYPALRHLLSGRRATEP